MKVDKRRMLREIRKKWDEPEKLLDYMLDFQKQLDLEEELIRKQERKETADCYSVALAYTLNYKYGFGKQRLPKVMEDIMYTFSCFTSEHLSLEDCRQELERVGVHIH